jgi:hypothetical protein
MTSGLKDTGEEFMTKQTFRTDLLTRPGSLDLLLFNDSTDALADSDDLNAITTEPSGGAYARQTVNLDSTDITVEDDANGDWKITMTDQTYDTSDSSATIDAYGAVVTFQSDDTGDSSATDHLFWTNELDQSYDLSNVDTFTLQNPGVTLQ